MSASASAKAQDLSGLNLGDAANYAFIDLGATTLGWNSGPIAGSVLFGQGLQANLSGGNNGGLSNGGILYHDSTATISGSLQNPVTQQLVPNSLTADIHNTVASVSSYASSLSPTQTFGNISATTTITGNGGLNVIDVNNIQNANITLSGGANDYFVFNVTGAINTNRTIAVSGGVDASHVLFNLTGTGTVFQTSGGNDLVGTYLATNGGRFQFSELNLNGELINTGGNVQFVSGSKITEHTPFVVPEPGSFALLSALGLGLVVRRRRA